MFKTHSSYKDANFEYALGSVDVYNKWIFRVCRKNDSMKAVYEYYLEAEYFNEALLKGITKTKDDINLLLEGLNKLSKEIS